MNGACGHGKHQYRPSTTPALPNVLLEHVLTNIAKAVSTVNTILLTPHYILLLLKSDRNFVSIS